MFSRSNVRLLMMSMLLYVSLLHREAAAAVDGYYTQPALHGDRLVFVSEGDLWTSNITAPDAHGAIIAFRLTSGSGQESRPCISPNGQMIAFTGEYDGNLDVYVMPIDGGPPKRLTFHGGEDLVLTWSADSEHVLFSSGRSHHFGREELWRISVRGGMPTREGFGECSMISLSSTGARGAFTRWSTETWTWKRYKGGTAPDIWLADLNAGVFKRVTDDPHSDQFPMWLGNRVYFTSDRTGTTNIWSVSIEGGENRQHTKFAADPANPTAIEGYDVRWPRADAQLRGTRIAFSQAGQLALLETRDDSIQRLNVKLASDRVGIRERFEDISETATGMTISSDGKELLIESRGELFIVDLKHITVMRLTRSSAAREWGAAFLGEDHVALITDQTGEQQVAVMPRDGSGEPKLVTTDCAAWLMPLRTSPDGTWIAFGDAELRLHVVNVKTLERAVVDVSIAGEVNDYRFSPDSQWLAFAKPMPHEFSTVHIYSLRTKRSFPISTGMQKDSEPRWDPAGNYLYFLSQRHLDPVIDTFDFEHVFINTSVVCAVALQEDVPPPTREAAASVSFDFESWAGQGEGNEAEHNDDIKRGGNEIEPIQIDTEGLAARQYLLPVEPGTYGRLEAVTGGVLFLRAPVKGLRQDDWGKAGHGPEDASLVHFDCLAEESKVIATGIVDYVLGEDEATIVVLNSEGLSTASIEGEEHKPIELGEVRARIDAEREWAHIFDEAWRMQRDFYWAPNMTGIDWPAMRRKYAAILPRVGTREELTDLIGQLIGELGTSHTYLWGGDPHVKTKPVNVGSLGADIEFDGRGFRITRALPSLPLEAALKSPLGEPYLGVVQGQYVHAINGVKLQPGMNPLDLLQDQAGKIVRLKIGDLQATTTRELSIRAVESDAQLRYQAWVEANRQHVAEASGGTIGYMHLPDMDAEGLIAFGRQFYPQLDKQGLVIDVRNNGGGFVSQMLIQRLARKIWAYGSARHGETLETYPARAVHAHMITLIDQHAGSDGDIFPASFRALGLGPLLGTRTWGGVIGIRADKPFVDFGISTQPEFAWWDARGWSIENEGVSPDIEVDILPEDRLAGRDPQLDRAIEYLKQKLEKEPITPAVKPPYPSR